MARRVDDPKHIYLKRPCRGKCGKYFQPSSKFNYICEDCQDNTRKWMSRKKALSKTLKRCKVCKKLLRADNQTLLCSYHYRQERYIKQKNAKNKTAKT